jgi:UDP-N-acetylmuramoyl-L-alanyl-D-glutamate--2,6-diaminopimelate ligase
MRGEFNIANALAAITIALEAGVSPSSTALQAVNDVQVPGRMERFVSSDGIVAYVDFAHNYLSTKTLIDEVERQYAGRNPRIVVVAGSTGGKALDRREGIVKGALGRAESFVFTTDDPDREDPEEIARQMRSYVTDPQATTRIVVDREQAVGAALQDAREHPDRLNILMLIGKGNETANTINGKPVSYPGDAAVITRLFAQSGGNAVNTVSDTSDVIDADNR